MTKKKEKAEEITELVPEAETPVEVEPVRRMTDAEIKPRYQAFLKKTRGGK